MKKIYFVRDNRGQVLGLPMYLIIVMIVAVAVIAAVIYMIPKGTQTLQASVTTGAVQQATTQTDGTATVTISGIVVNAYSNDERRDPIAGATVTISGLGTAITFTESPTGTYTSSGGSTTATLAANVDEGYLKLIVRAPGYENFEDPKAILVVRA